jgi:acetyl CoA:N6-hydroxylysine acetyl transferase
MSAPAGPVVPPVPAVPPPVALPAPWRTAEWRPMDPDADLDVLYGWMHQPHVAPYWELDVPRPRLAGFLRRAATDDHQDALLGTLDGRPASYWETYWAERDRLATFYPTEPYDQGVHLLIGPPELIGRGLGPLLLAAVAAWQFAREPRTRRLLAEPDARNERSVRLFERCGFRREAELRLPEKRAYLMVAHRGDR